MELTIEQALQQGVIAHNAGNQQEAERLYRVILQSQPRHPDANHNLGLIAISVNQVEAALPLFKTALDVNPMIEQFWVSYIDALVKDNQFNFAKQKIKKARKKGFDAKKLEALLSQSKVTVDTNVPSQARLSSLLDYYQNGRLSEAEKLAISITQEFPKHQLGWTVLGALFGQSGRHSEAVSAGHTAVALNPQDAEAHYNLGVPLQELGRLKEAEASYMQAIALKPDLAQAHYNLGIMLQETGRLDEAKASYTQAIALKPDYTQAYSNLGNTLQKLGRLDEAEASYTQAIALEPDYAEARSNLGITLQELGRLEEAEASYMQAIASKPDSGEAHSNLGITLQELGRLDEAEASYMQAIVLKPDYAEAHNNLGGTLKELGRLDEAEVIYTQAIALKPDYAEAHSNLGNMLRELGRLDEAEASLRQAIASKPDYAEAHNNLGNTLMELGRFEEGEASYRQALAIKPGYTEAHSNLLFLYAGFNYEASLYLKEARDYGCRIAETVTSRFSRWSCEEEDQTLRVGFVSGDLSNHPVGYFLEGLLNKLSRSKLELFAYPTKLVEDELTLRIKPRFAAWHPLISISDEEAANLIHSDGIHILIDLSGHTAKSRLPIFAWKPSPIQITWLGYFASTGIAEIDYILGDSYVTPVEEADHYTEKIWRLPESFLCFTEPTINVEVGPLPALSNGSVMFGCFNKIERMNDNVVAVWAKILKAIPGSRLFLKEKTLNDSARRRAVYSRFELVGIEKNQLILEGRLDWKSARSEYLAAYNRVDIALSPFPYGGGTTSVEGLWMGVPVIAKRGNHFLSHYGESIAHNAGLSNWIASDEDEYVSKAIEFSSNLDDLVALRSRLRASVVSSPLFDAERFANHFENALREMWGRWKEGTYPDKNDAK